MADLNGVVLGLLLATALRARRGWHGGQDWTAADGRLGLVASLCADLQFVLGLLLYLRLSPLIRPAWRSIS